VLASIDAFDLDSTKGLFLCGPIDHSKTRGACMLLERFCRHGSSVAMTQSTALVELFFQQFQDDGEKAVERLKKLKWTKVLLIDDIGKEKATERFETELFSLLEHRTSHLLKTLYTSNLSLVDLRMKFSKDQGAAIIRRIVQFSKCVEIVGSKATVKR
jgi:DNA replication protein DnaC